MVTQELARSIRAIYLEALVGASKCGDIVDVFSPLVSHMSIRKAKCARAYFYWSNSLNVVSSSGTNSP